MNSDILRKTKNVKPLILFLVITIAFVILAFVIPVNIGRTGTNYLDVYSKVYEMVYLEIDSKPIEFKTVYDGNTTSFYLVTSGDKTYIVKMSKKQYEVILDEYEKNKDNFKFTLEGKTYQIFSNLKESSMKVLNERLEEKVVTTKNYNEYLGYTYIDANENNRAFVKTMLFGFGVLFAVMDAIVIIGYIYGISTFKKVMREYGEEELVKELDDKDTIAIPKAGIYLTKKYIISNSTGFKVVDYKDILWVYILKQRNYGILVGSHLMVYRNNGKGSSLGIMRKSNELEELIPEIVKKNKDILVGYTTDNQKKYRDLVKENEK